MAFTSLNSRAAPPLNMEAFADAAPLQGQLRASLASHPTLEPVFRAVNAHVLDLQGKLAAARDEIQSLLREADALRQQKLSTQTPAEPTTTTTIMTRTPELDGPASKKRKLESNGTAAIKTEADDVAWLQAPYTLRMPEVSFASPVRKKLHLEIVGGEEGGIRGVDAKTGAVEVRVAWRDVEQLISTPIPEKATPAHYILVVPHEPALDTLVFSIADVPAKGVDSRLPLSLPENTILPDYLASFLTAIDQPLTTASAAEFLSAQVQPHRSAAKPGYTKAFRGSKEGYLLLLQPGILFGFKKPVLWFPFRRIRSISYQSVLQRTFNMVVAAEGVEAGKAEREEYEFGMLDQLDFAGIDEYVKRHGLHDESLADRRRAVVYGVNDPRRKKGMVKEEEQEVVAPTEAELQDAEDEEEEDFEPDEELSDGSGEDSNEDEDEDEDGVGGEEDEEDEEDE